MNHSQIWLIVSIVVITLFLTPSHATNGYFQTSYSPKSTGMAGATVAAPQDAIAAAVNPAGMGLVGERVDLSMSFFTLIREVSLDPRAVGGSFEVSSRSGRNVVFVPTLGFTRRISDKLSWGISTYANGLNTTYRRNIYDETIAVLGAAAIGGPTAAAAVRPGTRTGTPDTGILGVDTAQTVIAPTLSYQIHPDHTLGISALLNIQYLKVRGLGNFQCFTKTGATQNPVACAPGGLGPLAPGFRPSDSLTDNGYDWAFGGGLRVGWIGQVHSKLTLGVAASTRIYMTNFDKYRELFADNGNFDVPANITAGLAFRPFDPLLIAFDYQRIFYGDVKTIANPGPVPSPTGPAIPSGSGLLGAKNGLGFGWKDINIYRLGVQYQFDRQWTVRAGYSWNDQPFDGDQLLFNVISPVVNKQHATFGFTYRPNDHSEWNFAYRHALDERVSTNTTALGIPGSIKMFQNVVEIGYSWQF